jgi:hypothetical protein
MKNIFRLSMLCALLLLVGCASTGTSQAAKKATFHHTQDEFRVGTLQNKTWYTSEEFRREIRAIENRWDENGVPSHVAVVFRQKLPITYRMRFAMEEALKGGRASFHYAGIQLKSGVKLQLQRGAFTLTLQDPESDRNENVPDEGILIWYWEGQDRNYFDTARGVAVVRNELQKPEKKKPVEVYVRLPAKYEGWTLTGINLDSDNVQVLTR